MTSSVWKGLYRFQLQNILKSAGIMVAVVFLVQVIFGVILIAAEPSDPVYSNAQESSSIIFCFVLGCCMWKESFHFGMATGVTRKELFLCTLASLLTLCVILVPAELLVSLIVNCFLNAPTLFYLVYGTGANVTSSFSDAGFAVQGMLLQIAGSLALSYIGFFLGVVFYVIPKWLRVLLAIFIPVTLFAGLPSLLLLLPPMQMQALAEALSQFFSKPGNVTLVLFGIAVLFALLAWIPAHRASVMRNPQPSTATSG